MQFWQIFLYWLAGFLPARMISSKEGVPYLERYFICAVFGWQFYLHRFVGSDPTEEMHDHPWSWAMSLVLSGWYIEQLWYAVRPVRWINRISADVCHRIVLPSDAPNQLGEQFPHLRDLPTKKLPSECWTLFFHPAKRCKEWGFATKTMGAWQWRTAPASQLVAAQWWKTAPIGRIARRERAAR